VRKMFIVVRYAYRLYLHND